MMNPQAIAQMLLQSHPEIQQNPNAMNALNAILNNDAQTGMQLAQNMCQTRGCDPQQTAQQAQSYIQQQLSQMRPQRGFHRRG